MSIKQSKAKADRYFSKYIRERDKDKPCCTCGAYVSNKDCGHFISRRFDSVRFDEKNAHGQCQKCNRFEHGNQFAHSVYIDKLYGAGTSENLLQKSRMLSKRTKFDYEHLAIFFKEKLEKLTKKCRA